MATSPHGPVKVVRIVTRLSVGGPARHVLLLNEALSRRGYDTLLVHGHTAATEGSLEHLAADGGLRTRKILALGRRIRPMADLAVLGELVRLFFAETPDIVHTHTAKAGALGRIAASVYNLSRPRARRCLVVHTFHGHVLSGYFTAPVTRLVRLAERGLARVTDCVIAISASQRRELVDTFRVASSGQTVTIPLGLDLAPFLEPQSKRDARRSLGLGEHDLVIGFAGRFAEIKDLGTLVSSFATVARHVPQATLLLAGDGPTRPQLERLADQLSVRHRVKLIGWIADVSSAYAAMDVCCLSSLSEGTPAALIEAMAAGTPVVATRVGGVEDLVEDGRTGDLVPARNANALAQAILRLAGDPERRRLMGEAARSAVVAKYSVERLAHDIHSLYMAELPRTRGVLRAAVP